MMFAPGLLSIFCLIKSDNRTIHSLFYYVQIPGIIYSICINLSSDQLFYAISSASTVSAIAGFMIITLYIKDMVSSSSKTKAEKIVLYFAIVFILLQTFSEAYLRYTGIFWERSIKEQTEKIEVGAEKGLLVTQQKYNDYNALYYDTEVLRESNEYDTVLIFSDHLALYLDTDKNIGSYSPWTTTPDQITLTKLILYYRTLPDKLPDVIYATNTSEELTYFTSLGYKEGQSDLGIYMLIKDPN